MKILRLADISPEATPEPVIYADSCIVSGNRPMFLPFEATPWSGRIVPVYRIGRLGKNISLKFASRYVDAFTAALIAQPNSDNYPPGLAGCTDNTIALGQWLPIDSESSTLVHTAIDDRKGEFRIDHEASLIYESVAFLSKAATLKNGDIIIPPRRASTAFPLRENMLVKVAVGDTSVLAFHIK